MLCCLYGSRLNGSLHGVGHTGVAGGYIKRKVVLIRSLNGDLLIDPFALNVRSRNRNGDAFGIENTDVRWEVEPIVILECFNVDAVVGCNTRCADELTIFDWQFDVITE